MAKQITMDDIYGCSLEEWLFKHKVADVQCDIDMLKQRLQELVNSKEWPGNIMLVNKVREKLHEKEMLLKRIKTWRKEDDKAMQR